MRHRMLAWLLVLALFNTGCSPGTNTLEEMTITLASGVDLEENGDVIYYQNNPVFMQHGSGKSDTLMVKAETVRQSRGMMQLMSTGTIRGGKLRVLLVSKRFLQNRAAIPYLDAFLRDAKNPSNVTIAVVDSSVEEIMTFRPKEKHLSIYVHDLISTSYKEGSTVETLLRDYHVQTFEAGITTALTELVKKKNTVLITGAALLNKKGTYVTSLNREECSLLLFLQDEVQEQTSCTLAEQQVSMNLSLKKHSVQTSFADGKFRFVITLKVDADLTEVVKPELFSRGAKELEALITKEVQAKFEKLVAKLQKNQVDPVGLGLYARAFEYDHWKGVEKDWPSAFSQAKIKVVPEITIQHYGIIK